MGRAVYLRCVVVDVSERKENTTVTCWIDLDSNLPGIGECDNFVFKFGKQEIRCSKEELFDAIKRLLNG